MCSIRRSFFQIMSIVNPRDTKRAVWPERTGPFSSFLKLLLVNYVRLCYSIVGDLYRSGYCVGARWWRLNGWCPNKRIVDHILFFTDHPARATDPSICKIQCDWRPVVVDDFSLFFCKRPWRSTRCDFFDCSRRQRNRPYSLVLNRGR